MAGEALSEDKLCKVPLNFQISGWVRGKMNLELLELSKVHFTCSSELRWCLCNMAGQHNPFLHRCCCSSCSLCGVTGELPSPCSTPAHPLCCKPWCWWAGQDDGGGREGGRMAKCRAGGEGGQRIQVLCRAWIESAWGKELWFLSQGLCHLAAEQGEGELCDCGEASGDSVACCFEVSALSEKLGAASKPPLQ